MIAKKSKNASLEKKRFGIFLMGIVSASAFTLAAFEWQEIHGLYEHEKKLIVQKPVSIDEIPEVYYSIPKQPVSKPLPKNNSHEFVEKEVLEKTTDVVSDEKKKVEDIDIHLIEDGKIGKESEGLKGPIIEDVPITIPSIMPEYPGGLGEMYKFLQKNIVFPRAYSEIGMGGKVYLQFIVNKDGSLSDFKAVNNAKPLFVKEAIRVVKKMPNWKPGIQGDSRVRVLYTLPINFVTE